MTAALPVRQCSRAAGLAQLTAALDSAARAAGAEIRTGAGVEKVRRDGESVTGVIMRNGDEIDASVVIIITRPEKHLPRAHRA